MGWRPPHVLPCSTLASGARKEVLRLRPHPWHKCLQLALSGMSISKPCLGALASGRRFSCSFDIRPFGPSGGTPACCRQPAEHAGARPPRCPLRVPEKGRPPWGYCASPAPRTSLHHGQRHVDEPHACAGPPRHQAATVAQTRALVAAAPAVRALRLSGRPQPAGSRLPVAPGPGVRAPANVDSSSHSSQRADPVCDC